MSDLMKAVENQVVRNQLLELLQAAGSAGANEKVVNMAMRKAGYDLSEEQIRSALYYLEQKQYIRSESCENRALGIRMKVYMLAPGGTDVLEGTIQDPGIGVGSYGG